MNSPAVVFEAVRQVAFREVPVPEPGPRDVVVRTRYSLISNGTESSFLRGERVAGDTPSKPGDRLPLPQVTGYQKVGVVESAPAGSGLKPGQWVFATMSRIDWPEQKMGGHVARAVTDLDQVIPLPDGLEPEEACGLVLMQVGYNCGARAPEAAGLAALVIGDGLVGHWSAQTLQHRGARVVMLGRHRDRYARLTLRPGDAIVDQRTETDWLGAVRAAAPKGIDIVVDTVGDNQAVLDLFQQYNRGAHWVSAGFHGPRGGVDIQVLRNRELSLHTPSGWTRPRLETTLKLLAAGHLGQKHLITHRLPASKAPEAFQMILDKQPGVLGIVLDWNNL